MGKNANRQAYSNTMHSRTKRFNKEQFKQARKTLIEQACSVTNPLCSVAGTYAIDSNGTSFVTSVIKDSYDISVKQDVGGGNYYIAERVGMGVDECRYSLLKSNNAYSALDTSSNSSRQAALSARTDEYKPIATVVRITYTGRQDGVAGYLQCSQLNNRASTNNSYNVSAWPDWGDVTNRSIRFPCATITKEPMNLFMFPHYDSHLHDPADNMTYWGQKWIIEGHGLDSTASFHLEFYQVIAYDPEPEEYLDTISTRSMIPDSPWATSIANNLREDLISKKGDAKKVTNYVADLAESIIVDAGAAVEEGLAFAAKAALSYGARTIGMMVA